MTNGFICRPRIYEFGGWLFEVPGIGGPWPLKKDGLPRKRAGRKFYKVISVFDTLSDSEQDSFRMGGGCRAF